jgi:hypothetical protein
MPVRIPLMSLKVDKNESGNLQMNQETLGEPRIERVPVMQKVLDNPFLLLFLGVVFPTVFYIVWGVMELVTIPLAK